MSERGQKIFKWIVWSVITLVFILSVFNLFNKTKEVTTLIVEGPYTKEEWAKDLSDSFGDQSIALTDEERNNRVTGEFAVLSALNEIGEDRLSYFLNNNVTDQEKINLALKYEIIDKNVLKKNITRNQANEIIIKTLDLYCNPEYYPQYFETKTVKKVIDTSDWNIINYNEDNNIILTKIGDDIPNVGDAITLLDEFGIAHAKYVKKIDKDNSNNYSIELSNVEDISEILSEISFSGTSNFNYLLNNNSENNNTLNENTQKNKNNFNDFLLNKVYADDNDTLNLNSQKNAIDLQFNTATNDIKKCDIEFNTEIDETLKDNNLKVKVKSSISFKSDGITKKYKFEIDDSGKEKLSLEVSDEKGTASFSENENKEFKIKDDAKDSSSKKEVAYKTNVKIKGFAVCASGYFDLLNIDAPNNYVEVLASADSVNVSTSIKANAEKKVKIATLQIPIASTAGFVSVNLNFYFIVGVDGKLTVWYEIDNPYIGANVSMSNGLKLLHGNSDEDLGISSEVELYAGLSGEASIIVLNMYDLADPSVDVKAYASLSDVEVNDDYKLKDEYFGRKCNEIKTQAPVVNISISADNNSFLYKMLDKLKIDISYDIIKKDSDNKSLKKHTYHLEFNNDGSAELIELINNKSHTDVCTHIEKKTKVELESEGIKDTIDEEINRKYVELDEAMKEKIKEMIENAILEWLEENCGVY